MTDDAGGYADYTFVAEFYDDTPPYAARKDIDFYIQSARESGGPVLEVGCGTGRVLIPTAAAGVEITGLDLSDHMLAICRRRLRQEAADVRDRVTLVRGDMRLFDLGREFALVTTPFRPFQHLETVDDQMSCLQTIRRHLKPGGRLILDLFNPSLKFLTDDGASRESGDEPEFTLPDGRRVVRKLRVAKRNYFTQVQECEIIYYVTHPDGRKERLVHAFPMRYLFRFEAEHLLERCGFEVEALYADYDKAAYGSKDPGELIFLARKV